MSVFVCDIPPDAKARDFDPFPWSEKAIGLGCTCPEQRRWPEQLHLSSDCPIHELERVPS
jgi:hypothetical protein